MQLADPALPKPSTESNIYEVGTLRYTTRGLFVLFIWLLWGDFAFTFFESIFGRFIPLYLKDLQASNTLIGVMTGSFVGLVNLFFLPNISQWSDTSRGRWGRRIPFLYAVTPLTVASLVLIGFAPELGAWLHDHAIARFAPGVSVTTVILSLLCVLVVSFHFFNMTLVNAYGWLQRDVVPERVMARFLSWFRIVGTVSSFLFLWFVFPHVVSRRREVCSGVGLFYLVSFFLMCWNVKEGEYPPPPPKDSRPGIFKSFALYFRECLRIPIYRNFFIVYILVLFATLSVGPFSVLFARDTLGLDMDNMGKIFAWGTGVSLLVYAPMGLLCERFTPLRVTLYSLAGFVLASLLAFFLVHDKTTFMIYTIASSVPAVGWALGQGTATMSLFPGEKFGQFSSGLNVFGCAGLILGNYAMGKFMDLLHSNYRLSFLWSAAFFALAIIPMVRVYSDWKKYGGPHHYVPPLPD